MAADEKGSYVPTMLGSAISGTLARIPTHPIDTIKARLQAMRTGAAAKGSAPPGPWQLFRTVARTEGVRGLYRGIGVTLMVGPFASMLYFTGYEWSRDTLARHAPGTPAVATHLTAGMAAEALACILFVPVDVIKERMQVQGARPAGAGAIWYSGTVDAVRSIVAREGIGGVYRGYSATVGSFGPFSALYFALYEAAKDAVSGGAGALSFGQSLACAAAAGAAASAATNPLDLVKLRLQVQRGGGAADFGYSGLVHGLRRMAQEEGVAAMFRGAGTRVLFHAPTTAIAMAMFESCKRAVTRAMGERR